MNNDLITNVFNLDILFYIKTFRFFVQYRTNLFKRNKKDKVLFKRTKSEQLACFFIKSDIISFAIEEVSNLKLILEK